MTYTLCRLALGGGFGYLSGEYGLTIDNIVQVTIVTANGSILTANATENTDLFFGIRGGGSNFGVVTEFVLKLHEQKNKVYGGLVVFGLDKLEAITKELNEWWPTATPKEAVSFGFTRLPPTNDVSVTVVFSFTCADTSTARNHLCYVLQWS